MGLFIYDSQQLQLRLEDRTLAHLQIVIINKFRHGDRFSFSWKDDPAIGDGRSSIWLYPDVSLHFKFSGSRPPSINRTWLDQMYKSAASGAGLVLSPEPVDRQTSSTLHDDDIPGGPAGPPDIPVIAL
jgi:hypothetical protein